VHPAHVEPGEHQDLGPGGGHPAEGLVEAAGQVVGVAGEPDDVVATGRERDQVRAQPLGHRYLVRDDLVQQLAAHGEVGVAQPGLVLGQPLGDPVGPAARGPVRSPVVQAFGEAVPDRDEALPGAQRATPFDIPALP